MIRLVFAATLIVLGWGSVTPAEAMYCWDFAAQRYYPAEHARAPGQLRTAGTVRISAITRLQTAVARASFLHNLRRL
jgi:hypothetical protein